MGRRLVNSGNNIQPYITEHTYKGRQLEYNSPKTYVNGQPIEKSYRHDTPIKYTIDQTPQQKYLAQKMLQDKIGADDLVHQQGFSKPSFRVHNDNTISLTRSVGGSSPLKTGLVPIESKHGYDKIWMTERVPYYDGLLLPNSTAEARTYIINRGSNIGLAYNGQGLVADFIPYSQIKESWTYNPLIGTYMKEGLPHYMPIRKKLVIPNSQNFSNVSIRYSQRPSKLTIAEKLGIPK